MERKSIKINYFYNLLFKLFTGVIPLIIASHVSRVLGADGVGTVSYAQSIVSYFVLFATLGITTHGCKEISYYQDDISKRSEAFWEIKIIEFFTSIVALVLFLIFALYKESILYLVLSFSILTVFVDVTWFFQGIEEFKKIVIRNAIIKIVNMLFVFLFIRKKEDIYLYAFSTVFFAFIANAVFWMQIPKYVQSVNLREISIRRQIKPILELFIPTIAVQIYTVLDKTMLGYITGDAAQNGYYEQTTVIINAALSIITALGTVVMPRIGFYFKKKDYKSVNELMYKGFCFVVMMASPICFGFISTADILVPWLLGEEFKSAILLVRILALLTIFIGISNMTGIQYLIPTNRQKFLSISVVVGAVVNLCCNVVLIPIFHALGAAIGSVFSEFIVACIQILSIRKEISIAKILINSIKYLVAGFIMGAIVWAECCFLRGNTISILFAIFSGSTIYFTLLFVLKDAFFVQNLSPIFDKIWKLRRM